MHGAVPVNFDHLNKFEAGLPALLPWQDSTALVWGPYRDNFLANQKPHEAVEETSHFQGISLQVLLKSSKVWFWTRRNLGNFRHGMFIDICETPSSSNRPLKRFASPVLCTSVTQKMHNEPKMKR